MKVAHCFYYTCLFACLYSEILTLSSDDEDKQDKKPDMESQILANGSSFGLDAEAKALEATAVAANAAEGSNDLEGTEKLSEGVEGIGLLL